jgi:threonine synthase
VLVSTTFLSHLECSNCRTEVSAGSVQTVCAQCGRALLARYDLVGARKHLDRNRIAERAGTLWRYRELLPIVEDGSIVSLGEGWTPLLRTAALAQALGVPHLYIKDDGLNPTGSFKARGLCLAVSKARELGIVDIAMPSAGNAGGALAAYAAKAGIRAHVFVPRDTPAVNIREVEIYGGTVHLVDGVISDAARRLNELRATNSWFDASTMKEPYRLEGKKTMGYELAEQFGWKLPDVIIYPTGGGTGLIGMWKAFGEMESLGWIEEGRRPRMVCVQSAGCAPIVKALQEARQETEFWADARTVASGLRVPKAFADTLILQAIRESNGTALAVTDEELLADMHLVAREEGIFLCPEGAATVSALRHLRKQGIVQSQDSVVLFNTGTGYKYTELYLPEQKR